MVVLASAKANTPRTTDQRPDQVRPEHRRVRSRITERVRQEAVELYMSGISAVEVAERLDLGKSTVLRILKQADVAIRPQGPRLT
ncbi:helix-turn-helix domain-containing protein [Rhodococcoides corynebacterioides]|uniref:helix-turn-helix domain-containing protein n=1 Tax=Rhodococcoides corynebacterioides TaxID=53972 RepID=UPI0035305304|nr:helix-turn-helix domain-containing protein [Rhodococcus corynebacterioides]